jgi:hypothetical protein
MILGLLLNLYRDKEMCVTMGDVGGFFFSGMHLSLFLPSSNCGVVGASIYLPQESGRSILVRATGWWAQASLLMKVAVTPRVTESLIKPLKIYLSLKAREN